MRQIALTAAGKAQFGAGGARLFQDDRAGASRRAGATQSAGAEEPGGARAYDHGLIIRCRPFHIHALLVVFSCSPDQRFAFSTIVRNERLPR